MVCVQYAGITVKMITGDVRSVALYVSKEVGIIDFDAYAVSGKHLPFDLMLWFRSN